MSEGEASINVRHLTVADISETSERFLRAFSQTSAIGFAILDDQLRYQAINDSLAGINGIPAKAHLGFGVREIFGELSEKIAEPSYDRVLRLGETSRFEVRNAVLPTTPDSRCWGLNTNFPLRNRAGRVQQIGIVVVEVTRQRRLEGFLHKLAAELCHTRTQETFWFVRELKDSIDQYHAALGVNLELLVQEREKSTELLAQSVKTLDHRIMAMDKIVSSCSPWLPDHDE